MSSAVVVASCETDAEETGRATTVGLLVQPPVVSGIWIDRMHCLRCRNDQCVRQWSKDRVSVVDQGANAEPLTRRGVERCHLVAITVLREDRQHLALLL